MRRPTSNRHRIFIRTILLMLLCLAAGILIGGTTEHWIQSAKTPAFSQEKDINYESSREEENPDVDKDSPMKNPAEETKPDVLINVPYMSQGTMYPTGCESISTVMLMRYWEIGISVDTFIDRYLDRGEMYEENGVLYAPNPNDQFVGDPRTTYGYGCYAPVIEKALKKCLPEGYQVKNETGRSLSWLTENYLNQEIPLLLWVTIDLREPKDGTRWTDIKTGEEFQWISGEHCLVLTGYDKHYYYCNDPYAGRGKIAYPKALMEKRYQQMGKQALAIVPS